MPSSCTKCIGSFACKLRTTPHRALGASDILGTLEACKLSCLMELLVASCRVFHFQVRMGQQLRMHHLMVGNKIMGPATCRTPSGCCSLCKNTWHPDSFFHVCAWSSKNTPPPRTMNHAPAPTLTQRQIGHVSGWGSDAGLVN